MIDTARFESLDMEGKAVLLHTGWDRHWRTDAYFNDHPS
jgi:kynurenine formamidase